MHPLHDCCPYSKPSHFCIAHQTFTRWFPQNAQQLTAPNSNPSFLSFPHPTPTPQSNPFLKTWHQNTSNNLITTGQPTPHSPLRQTYGIYSADRDEHGTLPIRLRVSPVPCDEEWARASVTAREPHVASRPNTQGSRLTGSSPTSSEARRTGWGATLFVIMPWASRTAQSAAAALCWVPLEESMLLCQRLLTGRRPSWWICVFVGEMGWEREKDFVSLVLLSPF